MFGWTRAKSKAKLRRVMLSCPDQPAPPPRPVRKPRVAAVARVPAGAAASLLLIECARKPAREVQSLDGQWEVTESISPADLPSTYGHAGQTRNYFWYRRSFRAPATPQEADRVEATVSRRWVTVAQHRQP